LAAETGWNGMVLVFFRHGEAEAKKPSQPDHERRLTEKGKADVKAVARHLPIKPLKIVSSPLRRALETALIISSMWKVEVDTTDYLRPESPSGVDALNSIGVRGGEVLVGHNPWLIETVTELVGGRLALPPAAAAVVKIESLKPGGGILLSLITPDAVKRCSLG